MPVKGVRAIERQLARLEQETERTVKSGLKKLSFVVADKLGDYVASRLDFSGPITERYIARAWVARYKMMGSIFRADIYPRAKAAEVLSKHVTEGLLITARDNINVVVDGKIAVPVGRAKRNKLGRVPDRWMPGALLERDEKGRRRAFVSKDGRVVMYHRTKRNVEPIFALEPGTRHPKRIDIQAAGEAIIAREIGRAFGDAINRAMKRAASGA